MVRISHLNTVDGAYPSNYIEASGLSTDSKPTENVAQGSIFVESDTGDVYIFTESTQTWGKLFSLKEA